jgi:hypothetical protein
MGWGTYKRTEKERSDESELCHSEQSNEDCERGRRTKAGSSSKQKKRRKDPSRGAIPVLGSVFGSGERVEQRRSSSSKEAKRDPKKKNRKREEKWYKTPKTSIRWGLVCRCLQSSCIESGEKFLVRRDANEP